MYSITLTQFIEKLNLVNHLPEIDTDKILITDPDINRPAVQLSGFFEHFDANRIQICGNVEHAYITSMHDADENVKIFDKLFQHKIPCLVFCRGLQPQDFVIEAGRRYGVPVLTSEATTSSFVHETVRWLHVELAPRISIHAVLVDVYGVGILITGESGIGKSEATLELIKRGHRLITDDAVDIKEIDRQLIGKSPKITLGMIEVRGIGIIDVSALYGLSSVVEEKEIDLVIHFENWQDDAEYDRLGTDREYEEILGVKVRKLRMPIRPGRNIAVLIEAAAANYRYSLMSDISPVDVIEQRIDAQAKGMDL